MLMVLLQNGWSRFYRRIGRPGEPPTRMVERIWDREDWIDATWSCLTGRRLQVILAGVPEDQIWLDDTTLEIADKASGVKPPDLNHVASVIKDQGITMVLACGKQAAGVIDKVWSGPVIKIPHPAVRGMTTEHLRRFNSHVVEMRYWHQHGEVLRLDLRLDGNLASDCILYLNQETTKC